MDYLTEDSCLPEGQKFVCLSFLTDKDNKSTLAGVKVRGVFSTYETACDFSKRLQTIDPYFNVFVGDMGKWLPFDPSPDSEAVKNSEYGNDQLNTMMKAYLENQEKAKIYHEQRKNEMVRQNILDNLTVRKDNLSDLANKMKKVKSDDERQKLETDMKTVEDQISKMDLQSKDLDKQIEKLEEQLKSFTPAVVNPPKIPQEYLDSVKL